jgi:branched-chain amino acid transport system substrate-binding protein
MRKIKVLTAVLVVTALAAGCGGNDGGNKGAENGTVTSKPVELTGNPIRLGLITRPLYVDFAPAGAKAAIKRINDAGGIDGRPLELVVCSNGDNANVAADCARQFAADPTIIATVGDNNSFGGDSNPPLEQAKIAGIGTSPLGGPDYASPRVFPNNSGGLEFLASAAFMHDDRKADSIGMATVDTPTAQALPGLIDQSVLGPRGAKLAGSVAIPLTAADVSAQAASVSGSDGLLLALTGDLALRFMQSARQQGFGGPFVLSETVVDAAKIKEALSPDVAKDIFTVTYYDKNSDGYRSFLADMEKYESKVVPGDLSAIAWLAVNMFEHVAADLPHLTRESVWDAMNALSDYDTKGMTPGPLDFTTPGTALGGKAPRLVPSVLSVYVDRYDDGTYVPLAKEQKPIAIFGQ